MIDHTKDLLLACHEAGDQEKRSTMALILADWLEDQGNVEDAGVIRVAVESGMDGFKAVLSVPSGGSGKKAGDVKVLRLGDQELRFRWCPPGSFTMGSPPHEEGRDENENQVPVRLTRGFWMQEVPVTQGLWLAANGPELNWSFFGRGESLPATGVSHWEAVEFAESLTDRLHESGQLPVGWRLTLPTEAQWEYACRAGTTTRFPWGDDEAMLDQHAWHAGNSGEELPEVGRLLANSWGIHDMLGLVWEWCLDAWVESHPGGDDPFVGSGRLPLRAHRGGCFLLGVRNCRPACRFSFNLWNRGVTTGFRLVMTTE